MAFSITPARFRILGMCKIQGFQGEYRLLFKDCISMIFVKHLPGYVFVRLACGVSGLRNSRYRVDQAPAKPLGSGLI